MKKIDIKQRQIVQNDTVFLDGLNFTIDNAGEDDLTLTINDLPPRKIPAGEQFVIESVQGCLYENVKFQIQFAAAASQKCFIWYTNKKY
jgi:hypothetical protein